MSYIVIARRWRPQQFSEIIGQEHVSKTLSNAIANNRIAHSYIFTGPRGVGKTTTARILAKAVNCEKGPTPTPCNECASCKAITLGNALDVLEIDGASNRGIDEIRNLRENIRFTPSQGRYRVYIIDEVHMLTKEAFNALLKTLEEPPEHVIFIFATTEIHRVPATILSRCQRFDFRRIPLKTIMAHLQHICEAEKIDIEEEALLQIAKKADGSMRDSQSILDQIISYSGDKILFEDVAQALGVIHQDLFFRITQHIISGDIKALLKLARDVFSSGYDLNEFLLGLEEHFRNILVLKSTGLTDYLDVSENYVKQYGELVPHFSENDLVAYLQVLAETAAQLKDSQQPNLKFELGLIKLAKMPKAVNIETLLEKIELLKKKAHNSGRVAQPGASEYAIPDLPEKILALSDIKKQWPQIIHYVHQSKISLATVLEKAELIGLQEYTLNINLKNISVFEKELIENNKEFLSQICCQTLETLQPLRLEFKYEIVSQNNGRKKSTTRVDKKELMEKIRREGGKVIERLIDEMDLDVQ